MGETKKVGLTGRFGSRYGVGIRKRVLKTEILQKRKHECPKCGKENMKRTAAGIFECKFCENKVAGGAFVPETLTGKLVRKMISQKKFSAQEFEALQQEQEKLNFEPEEEHKKDSEHKEHKKEKPEHKEKHKEHKKDSEHKEHKKKEEHKKKKKEE